MTETPSFGSSKRESHDARRFYNRGLIEVTEDKVSDRVPPTKVDFISTDSAEEMKDLPDSCVSLLVTSPPYHTGKDYDTDVSFDDYLGLLHRVFMESYRVLEPGGRAAINCAGLGRKPYVPLQRYVDQIMTDIGYFPRGEIIWIKGKGSSGNCAWGTFGKALNPVLRDLHEYILVYSKGRFSRCYEGESTISKEDFMAWTLSTWEMRPESAKRVGHPAPFPVELPRRLIELYTYKGDLILDPFMGSGTTAIAAIQSGRHYVGYDTNSEYVKLAEKRIKEAL